MCESKDSHQHPRYDKVIRNRGLPRRKNLKCMTALLVTNGPVALPSTALEGRSAGHQSVVRPGLPETGTCNRCGISKTVDFVAFYLAMRGPTRRAPEGGGFGCGGPEGEGLGGEAPEGSGRLLA